MRLRTQDGWTLVTTMVLITVVLTLGTAVVNYSVTEYNHSTNDERRLQAHYIARSGADAVASAIENGIVNVDDIVDKTSSPLGLGEGETEEESLGTFIVDVSRDENKIIIESTGAVDGIEDTVIIELMVGDDPEGSSGNLLFDKAVFADEGIEIIKGGKIYGDVSTNSTDSDSVIMDGGAKISENLYIGPDGNPDTVIDLPHCADYKSFISGEIYNLSEILEYTLPEFPDFPDNLEDKGDFTAEWWPTPPPITEDGYYNNLTVLNDLTIEIYDEDRIIRVKNLSTSGDIIVNRNDNGKLILYVDNSFEINGGSKINENGDPNDVIMYYKGTDTLTSAGDTEFVGSVFAEDADINMGGAGTITGHILTGGDSVNISGGSNANVRILYAPYASVDIIQGGEITGALIANDVRMTGGGSVTYDDSLELGFLDDFGFFSDSGGDYSRTWK